MLEIFIPLLVVVTSLALLQMGTASRGRGILYVQPVSQGANAGIVQTAPPPLAGNESWSDAIEHLNVRLNQATATQTSLEQTIGHLEREKVELEAKYLARVKVADVRKQRLAAWREKQSETRKGLSDHAAEIIAEKDKWLPHAREGESKYRQAGQAGRE